MIEKRCRANRIFEVEIDPQAETRGTWRTGCAMFQRSRLQGPDSRVQPLTRNAMAPVIDSNFGPLAASPPKDEYQADAWQVCL